MDGDQATTLLVKGLTSWGLLQRIRRELTEAGYRVNAVSPGRIVLAQTGPLPNLEPLLGEWGIFLLEEREQQLMKLAKTGLANRLAQGSLPLRSLLKQLSQQTACPYEQLNDLFLATQGLTFGRYVVLQRLDKAIERLTYTRATVAEIARQTGYQDEAHLIKHLDAERGLPPAHFLALRPARVSQEQYSLLSTPVGSN